MNEGHLVASNAMTGGTLLTHPVRSNDLNDARARRRNLLRNDEDRVCARSAQLLRVSVVGSLIERDVRPPRLRPGTDGEVSSHGAPA